jgi:hypothetical protein
MIRMRDDRIPVLPALALGRSAQDHRVDQQVNLESRRAGRLPDQRGANRPIQRSKVVNYAPPVVGAAPPAADARLGVTASSIID